jgi:hypothetical protein
VEAVGVGEEMAQIMYTYVSKCKKDKIKKELVCKPTFCL